MYILYQVGDLPLYNKLVGAGGDAIEVEVEYGWGVPETNFTANSGRRYAVPATRSIPDAVSISFTASVQATDYMTASRIKNRIRSFAGRRNMPIIVMQYDEDFDNPSRSIMWLIAYGIMNSDENASSYAGEDFNKGFAYQELEIELVITEPFRQLPTAFWEYRPEQSRSLNLFAEEESVAGMGITFWHPQQFFEIQPNNYFVKWMNSETMLNTEYWALAHLTSMSESGIGSDFDEVGDVHYFSNEDMWTLAPRPLYAFKNLTPYGTVSITVKLKTGLYFGEEIETVTTLDIEQLDLDLANAGYGGIAVDDIIYTGDFYPRPGFVMRNGVELTGVRPRWSYSETYPGELPNGYTIITFSKYLNDAQVAYLIDFGGV